VSTGVTWATCPPGQWTQVSNQPAPAGYINVWSRDGEVQVLWRRYQAGVPFFTEGSSHLFQGQNTWYVTPDFINTWWFNPTGGVSAALRLT
jgi:hypothetical protein